MDNLRFESVKTREQFDKIKDFAASFDHKIDNSSIFPIVIVSRGDKMIAYYHLITHPIVVPAFHPEHCSPRDFIEVTNAVKYHHQLMSMDDRWSHGTFYTTLPLEEGLQVDRSIIEKLGLSPLSPRAEIFQANG